MKERVVFKNLEIRAITENDFQELLSVEQKIYDQEDRKLVQDENLIKDIKNRNGLAYSIVLLGNIDDGKEKQIVGYIIAIDYKTEEGESCVYLEDIAVLLEARRQGFGWIMMKHFIEKLPVPVWAKNKTKGERKQKSVLFAMHLLKKSRAFMDKHERDLNKLGVTLVDKHIVHNYYYKGADAEYRVYEII